MDLSTLDPAALINSVAHETRFAIGSAAEFNARWRAALRERFEAQGVVDELEAWLATGLSNGRPLRLSVMAIKPNDWFCVHAHPNIELMQTLVGTAEGRRVAQATFPSFLPPSHPLFPQTCWLTLHAAATPQLDTLKKEVAEEEAAKSSAAEALEKARHDRSVRP